ncbi:hypothetical protein Cob_v007612 [Colletotrichum orbiculare MAFF 240422]|uniref:Uncharacterized protein n=1 Tax=Colletotrichum orbiculare (strain 104-T / ATCC 96160 / CBS 514.97 / LARS 414 / MAFF 240422) TaxID=1213857 RepID=A0A484FLH7_COLOR|nr:hypothetical protein Cob_v007612 [Colletotrichum orbiculare MAFF 240422]
MVSQILAVSFVSVFMAMRFCVRIFVAPPFQTEDYLALVAWRYFHLDTQRIQSRWASREEDITYTTSRRKN